MFSKICSNKEKSEIDADLSCRLRHGLNVNCLAQIFQYLTSMDLYNLGSMDTFYCQIIHKYVISKHKIDFELLKTNGIPVHTVLERHASRIRKFHFDGDCERDAATFIQLISHHCSENQLKDVRFSYHYNDIDIFNLNIINVHLPAQFDQMETFHFDGPFYDMNITVHLYVRFSCQLKYLKLEDVVLQPNIEWIEAINLRHIHLDAVNGLNIQNFLAFLRRRPKLKRFYQKKTFGNLMQIVGETMAEYCGEHIQVYRDLEYDLPDKRPPNFYQFLSRFKNVNEVWLSTRQICAGDLLAPIHRLADTKLEKLVIVCYDDYNGLDFNCMFMDKINCRPFYLNSLNHLKTIRIDMYDGFNAHTDICEQMKVLTMYSSQIFPNVENIFLMGANNTAYDYGFIKNMLKLRLLVIDSSDGSPTSEQSTKLISVLEYILQERNNGQITDDRIELKINRCHLKLFQDVHGIDSSIKLTGIQHFSEILSNYFTK